MNVSPPSFRLLLSCFLRLTDPKARANWEKYGNPDGPPQQQPRMGVALPKFLSQKENGVIVLILYFIVLGAILFGLVLLFFLLFFFLSFSNVSHFLTFALDIII